MEARVVLSRRLSRAIMANALLSVDVLMLLQLAMAEDFVSSQRIISGLRPIVGGPEDIYPAINGSIS